jgi:uncharacterized protein YqjF (DUF2071 family)
MSSAAPIAAKRVFLTAEWRDLVMLNYEVDPSLLHKYVPAGTELDQWNGQYFISLVAFRFLKTRVRGIAFPFHSNFDEANLRFYVRRREGEEVRRGVVFIREIVPRWMIATVARVVYNERYVALPMSHKIESEGERRSLEYAWKSQAGWSRLQLKASGPPHLAEAGSQEQFITEHYWGYAAQRSAECMEYRVAHPSWRVWTAESASFEGDVENLYGPALAEAVRRIPSSAFLAEGSPVEVYQGCRL